MTFDELTANRPVQRYYPIVLRLDETFYMVSMEALNASSARTNAEEWDFIAAILGCPMTN